MDFLQCFLLQIYIEDLVSFGSFGKFFCKTSFAGLPLYKEAIFQVIEVRDKNNAKCKYFSTNTTLKSLFFMFVIISVTFVFLHILNFLLALSNFIVCEPVFNSF